ncbi:MAG: hypothetical protein AAF563_20350 [Pseudomonadota bacterium]
MDSGSRTSNAVVTVGLAATLLAMATAAAIADTGESPQSQNTTISIIIPERVSVREVSAVSTGASSNATDEQGTVDLCVWSQGGSGYQVTVISDTGDYKLTNGEAPGDIGFTVKWNDQLSETGGTAIPYDTAMPLVTLASTTPTCGGVGNSNSTIVVDTAEGGLSLQQANAAGYDATLTVTVAATP